MAHDKSRHPPAAPLQRRRRRVIFRPMKTVLALALCLTAPPAIAEVRAVLVGVGDYQFLDADLRGPGPDVALMAGTLLDRGIAPSRITALTTAPGQLPPGIAMALPTHDAILDAMAAAGAASGPGDTMVFYFSGHGSQTPDQDGDEPGGQDEILLPMDVRGWTGAEVQNALRDDDLRRWAQGLLDRGVQVVGMIDACHSGTGFRAAPGAGTARVVAPEALGIPDDAPEAAPVYTPPLRGEFVFLYSSQPDQRSFEYPLDPADPEGRWQGSFTLALSRALQAEAGASWAQVLAATRATMQQGAVRQDPDGEGPLLQASVFGTGPATGRLPVTRGTLQAGLLEGLATGTEVTLYRDPGGGEALAQAHLTALTASTARLDPAPPATAAWAEVTLPAPLPPLRLAPLAADATGWAAALQASVDEGLAVWATDEADLVPVLTGDTLALAAPDGILDPDGPGSTPRITPQAGEDITAATLRIIERAGHALRFRDVMAGLAGRRPGKPVLTLDIERRPVPPAADGCGEAAQGQAFDAADPLNPCDQLWLTLTNRSGQDQDVTVFYLAQDFTITALWPANDISNRLAPGESARTGLQIAPDTPANAIEDVLVVAVLAVPGNARADLARLATPDRLRGSFAGLHPETDLIERLLDPDQSPRGFSAARPALAYLRQTLHITPPSR